MGSLSSPSLYGTGLFDNPRYVVFDLVYLYLQILIIFNAATSVDVERVFSLGCILLSHVHSRLSTQSTQALMCVGAWSLLGYVKDFDIKSVVSSAEIPVDEKEDELAYDWDAIEPSDS